MMPRALEGKVALVTGAGRNIGRAIALALARDGAQVIVNGRQDIAALEAVVNEIQAEGGRARAYLADIAQAEAVAIMAETVARDDGGLDILVCNAGLRRQTPFLTMSFTEWREIMSVALDGAFLLCRAFLPQMVARGGGAIVALSGISTHIGTPQRAHVAASKAGLEGLIRALAVEFGPYGIRANCVAPGAVDTLRGASAGAMPPRLAHDEAIPLRRKARSEEIAAVVRLLVGPEGGYITGQTIHINGGAYLT